jgi:hypothetical protein
MTPGGDTTVRLPEADRGRFRLLQAYEDAVAYRTARLATPCLNCGPQRCDEHAVDASLIAAYRRAAAVSCRAIPARSAVICSS